MGNAAAAMAAPRTSSSHTEENKPEWEVPVSPPRQHQQQQQRSYHTFDTDPNSLPHSVDLRRSTCFPYLPPNDQGSEGSCVMHAMGGAIECAQRRSGVPLDRAWDPRVDTRFALAMRKLTKLARAQGDERYQEDGLTFAEAASAYERSGVRCYWLVPNLVNLKQAIYSGYPFVFGFAVTKRMRDWQDSELRQKLTRYELPGYSPTADQIDGYHSALAVGYDDSRRAFLVRNSWGESWGDGGHFWFPYDTMSNEDIVQDVVIIDVAP